MKRFKYLGVLAVGALGASFTACAGNEGGGPEVRIQTSPLSLPGVGNACYTIIVKQAFGGLQTVWSESNICAQSIAGGPAYGTDNGDITYIGTCDADDGDTDNPASALNSVQLILTSLYDDGGNVIPAGTYQNPCQDGFTEDASGAPTTTVDPTEPTCFKNITCNESQDSFVDFNITLMRDANQGFFDIAVNFQDLFCSAKFDCEYSDDPATSENEAGPIKLLFNGANRGNTAVLAFACTSGLNGSATNLYLNDVAVSCDNGTSSELDVSPTQLGNQAVTGTAPLFAYAVYSGIETLPQYFKGYWNVAIGFGDLGTTTCTVSTRATASETALTNDTTPNNTSYPVINFAIDVGQAAGSLDCGQHPLNGDDSVHTEYSLVEDASGECFSDHGSVGTANITLGDSTVCP